MFRYDGRGAEPLDEAALETITRGWRRLISEIGVQFDHPEARRLFAAAEQIVDGDVVRLDPDFVLEQAGRVPRSFTLLAAQTLARPCRRRRQRGVSARACGISTWRVRSTCSRTSPSWARRYPRPPRQTRSPWARIALRHRLDDDGAIVSCNINVNSPLRDDDRRIQALLVHAEAAPRSSRPSC